MAAAKSYPAGAGLAGGLPAHAAPFVAVNADWVAAHGSRAQRRRIAKAVKRKARPGARDG